VLENVGGNCERAFVVLSRRCARFPALRQRRPQQVRGERVAAEMERATALPNGVSVVSSTRFISGVSRDGTYQLSASDST
jgi:hypothetical protein